MDHVKFCRIADPFMRAVEKMLVYQSSIRWKQRSLWYYTQLMYGRCSRNYIPDPNNSHNR